MIPTLSTSDGIHSPVETHHKPKHWPYKEHLAFSIYTVFPLCGCQAFLDKSAAGSSDRPPSVTAEWRSLFSQASAQTSRRPATLGSRRETPSVGCSWEAFATHHQWNKHYACISYPLLAKSESPRLWLCLQNHFWYFDLKWNSLTSIRSGAWLT